MISQAQVLLPPPPFAQLSYILYLPPSPALTSLSPGDTYRLFIIVALRFPPLGLTPCRVRQDEPSDTPLRSWALIAAFSPPSLSLSFLTHARFLSSINRRWTGLGWAGLGRLTDRPTDEACFSHAPLPDGEMKREPAIRQNAKEPPCVGGEGGRGSRAPVAPVPGWCAGE